VLTIQARATGRELPLAPDRTLPTDGWEAGTLRELIERVVRDDAAALGGLIPGGAPADPTLAAALALQAFEDGVYLVLLDGRRQRDLDAPAAPGGTLTFLRLGALAA
jgi:hypothetical protein